MVLIHDDFPGLHHLIRIAWADHQKARESAQVSELLDWLVSWAVLAHANRIMGEDVNDRQLHQGAEANSAARVVTEDEEPRSIGPHFHQTQSVQNSRHPL